MPANIFGRQEAMRHIRRNGLVALMATSGALALAAGTARADADAFAAAFDSVGMVTGDEMQLPMDSPVSVCGDTVNAEGLLNPEAGSTCEEGDEARGAHGEESGTSRASDRDGGHGGGTTALAGVIGSPGAVSDDGIRLPVDLPVKVSGNAVSIVAFDESDFDDSGESGGKPPAQDVTPSKPAAPAPPAGDEPAAPMPVEEAPAPAQTPTLAVTGAGDLAGMGLPAAGLVLAGALLYRRSRSSAARA